MGVKTQTPFGQAPMVEVDGHKIAQSSAMARFVARKANLCGNNEIEAALCDMWVDYCNEIVTHLIEMHHAKDEDKPALHKKLVEEAMPLFFKRVATHLAKNNGWLVSKQV